jgi:predicted SAM-dependent methyltransferase
MRINVRGSANALPFRDNSFEVIHFVHCLEHLTRDKHLPVLKECQRVLKPGGSLFVEVPDFQAILTSLYKAYQDNDGRLIHIWKTSIWGKTERPGMQHHYGFDANELIELSRRAIFSNSVRLITDSEMISLHYTMEPIILMRMTK